MLAPPSRHGEPLLPLFWPLAIVNQATTMVSHGIARLISLASVRRSYLAFVPCVEQVPLLASPHHRHTPRHALAANAALRTATMSTVTLGSPKAMPLSFGELHLAKPQPNYMQPSPAGGAVHACHSRSPRKRPESQRGHGVASAHQNTRF